MLLFLTIILLVLFVYYVIIKPHKYWKEKEIPYLQPWPLLGTFAANVLKKIAFVDNVNEIYKEIEGKRYIGLYQFLQPVLLIRDVELIKQITVKEFDNFPDHRSISSVEMDPIIRRNMFNMRRDEGWHNVRTTLSPAFTSSKMKILFTLVQDSLEQFVEYFQSDQNSPIIELVDTFTRITNDVIATTAFGITCNSLQNKNNEFYCRGRNLTNFTGLQNLKLLLSLTIPDLLRFLNIKLFDDEDVIFFKNLVENTIKFRKEKKITRSDMLQLLIEAKNYDKVVEKQTVEDSGFAVVHDVPLQKRSNKQPLTDADILSQAYIFFFAGFESVSVALCHTAYELAINPNIQKRLQDEIDETLLNNNGKITYEALLRMKYLDCVVSEGLRLRPPSVMLDRMSVKPFTIEPQLPGEKPIHLDANTIIFISVWSLHHDPQHYPNPEKFDPERFNDENKHNIKPFTYLPFGAGPRNCVGSRFALMEIKLVIVKLLQHFDIVPTKNTLIPMRIGKNNFSPIPEEALWVELKKRKN